MSIKILTVDDSKTIRLIVAKELKPYDCTVLEADNGVVGLAVASREKPDVILLDYTMPVMDGLEVLTRLRADPELKATPVIMLTAEAGRDRVIQIAKLGVKDYLIKPFKGEVLVERVRRLVALRAKSDAPARAKRFDDPIRVLVVDDKPAIVAQIRTALSETSWQVANAEQPGPALELCRQKAADIVVASLALPGDGAHVLFQSLRDHASTAAIPVLGMSVRTAAEEQARAQQTGFAGIIAKPIEAEELKTKVSRALKLETAYKYFKQHDGALVLIMPKELSPDVFHEISNRLERELNATVDAGGDRLIVDLGEVQNAGLQVIELALSAIRAGGELSLKHAIIAPEAVKTQCLSYQETQFWCFADNLDAVVALAR
jgi:two-component system cell cycle response regulator